MKATIKIPYYLRDLTGKNAEVEVNGGTVIECLRDLSKTYSGMKDSLFDSQGNLLLKWLIYLDDSPILSSSEVFKEINNNSIIGIYPVVSGG